MERFGTILRQVARTSSAGQSSLPGTVVTGQPTRGFSAVTVSDEDIVILSALRTPIGKANKGMLKVSAQTVQPNGINMDMCVVGIALTFCLKVNFINIFFWFRC